MASSSQAQGTSMKTDRGSDVLDGEEHVHIANNNSAGKIKKKKHGSLLGELYCHVGIKAEG